LPRVKKFLERLLPDQKRFPGARFVDAFTPNPGACIFYLVTDVIGNWEGPRRRGTMQ
jgi:hypothetical protein